MRKPKTYMHLVGAIVQAYLEDSAGKILPSEAVAATAKAMGLGKEYVASEWGKYMLAYSEQHKNKN